MRKLYRELTTSLALDMETAGAIAGAVLEARRKRDVERILRDTSYILGGFGGVGVVEDPNYPIGEPGIYNFYVADLLCDSLPTLWARRRKLGFYWVWGVESVVNLNDLLAKEGKK